MLIAVNEHDARPIYQQIVAQVKEQVSNGMLRAGEELPGVRELADSLGINLHTVHRAYRELHQAGIIYLRLGRRARIAEPRKDPATRKEIDAVLVNRLNELITEAFHLRVGPEEFRQLVNEVLEKRKGERS